MLIFLAFLAYFGGFVLLFGFGRFRVRWTQKARPHLTLPFCLLSLLCVFLLFLFFFWKVYGLVGWPGGSPHLALSLPCFVFFVVFWFRLLLVLFYYLCLLICVCVVCLFLSFVLWFGLGLLFCFQLVNQNTVFPAILVFWG